MGVPWGRPHRPGFTDTPKTKTYSNQTNHAFRWSHIHYLRVGFLPHIEPVYGAVHWCPHPLWQHFSSVGQSLSSEQSSAHSPELQRLRGHTPGLAEGTRESTYQCIYKEDLKLRSDSLFSYDDDLTKDVTTAHWRKSQTLWLVLKAGGTQTAPQSKTQHLWSSGQSSSHTQPLCDGTTLRRRGQWPGFGRIAERKEAVKQKRRKVH